MIKRHQYGYPVIALLLLGAAAGMGGAQSAATTDIAGTYMCAGTNADGTTYHGVVTIVRRADAYYLWWELQPRVTAVGVGLREGDTLGVSYYGPNTGVIVYRIMGDRLMGRWTVAGADTIASETLIRMDAPLRSPSEHPGVPGESRSEDTTQL